MATISVGASNGIPMNPTSSTQNAIPAPTPTSTAPAPTATSIPSDPQTVKAPAGEEGGEATVPTKPYYHFDVAMSCGACSGAVERVLKKNIVEPNSFIVSLKDQTAIVWGPTIPSLKDVEAKIAKTGKILDAKVVE